MASPKDDDASTKEIRVDGRVLTEMEPWFEVPYVTKDFSQDSIKRWISLYDFKLDEYNSELVYPKRNPFIVTKEGLRLKPLVSLSDDVSSKECKEENSSSSSSSSSDIPTLIEVKDQEYRVWHKQDRTFLKPKAHCWFLLCCPDMVDGLENTVLTDLVVQLCEDRMTSVAYLADLAQLWCSVRIVDDGLSLHVYGFDEKLADLALKLAKCLSTLSSWTDLKSRLEVAKECVGRSYRNKFLKPSRQSKHMRLRLLLDRGEFSASERIAMLEKCDVELLRSHCNSLFGTTSNRLSFMEVFCMGNMLPQDSIRLARDVAKILQMKKGDVSASSSSSSSLPLCCRWDSKCIVVPTTHVIRSSSKCVNPEEGSSVSEIYFQLRPSSDFDESCKVDLLSQIIDEPFYDVLRTKMQLGYYVDSSSRMSSHVLGFCFVIKGDAVNAKEAECRVMQFLKEFYYQLKKMPRNKFASHRLAVSQEKTEPDDSMGEEARRLFGEISTGRFQFRRWSKEAERVLQISQNDFVNWFHDRFCDVNTTRRLVVHVNSEKKPKGYRGSDRYRKVKHIWESEKSLLVSTCDDEKKKCVDGVMSVKELHLRLDFHETLLKILMKSREHISSGEI